MAKQAARKRLPRIRLMDLDLPVVDGWEASRRLKNKPSRGCEINLKTADWWGFRDPTPWLG